MFLSLGFRRLISATACWGTVFLFALGCGRSEETASESPGDESRPVPGNSSEGTAGRAPEPMTRVAKAEANPVMVSQAVLSDETFPEALSETVVSSRFVSPRILWRSAFEACREGDPAPGVMPYSKVRRENGVSFVRSCLDDAEREKRQKDFQGRLDRWKREEEKRKKEGKASEPEPKLNDRFNLLTIFDLLNCGGAGDVDFSFQFRFKDERSYLVLAVKEEGYRPLKKDAKNKRDVEPLGNYELRISPGELRILPYTMVPKNWTPEPEQRFPVARDLTGPGKWRKFEMKQADGKIHLRIDGRSIHELNLGGIYGGKTFLRTNEGNDFSDFVLYEVTPAPSRYDQQPQP